MTLERNAIISRRARTIKAPFQCLARKVPVFLVFSAAFFADFAVFRVAFAVVAPVLPAFAAIYSFLLRSGIRVTGKLRIILLCLLVESL